CEDSVFNNRSRPCLLHQIKRCSAPCVGRIDELSYAADIRHAVLFMHGKDEQVISDISEKMKDASRRQAYETAALYRDQILALQKIHERQFISSAREVDADVVACELQSGLACVNLVMIRGGRHLGDKSFFPQNAEDNGARAVIEAFLAQHYLDQAVVPSIIVGAPIETKALEALLSAQANHRVRIQTRPSKERRVWLQMAQQNCRIAIEHRLTQQLTLETRLQALQQSLDLPPSAQRIECFDVSHTMGEATVASCVVFDHGVLQNSEYRHYNIGDITPGDDVGAMRQVLSRRYRKLSEGEGKVPDLILIDGGKAQVSVAREALEELGVSDVELIGVAKGEGRKPGLEQLVFADARTPLRLPSDHPGLHLIQQIRDEAHRFALTGHRARRTKARIHSTLEEIPGIGARRRQRLLTRLGGMRGVLAASMDEIAKVEGIGPDLAAKIYQNLH
ncbi:MAG: excinuclease ABC subunit UvrC, partial [Burkholderiales bacterium]